MVHHCRPLSARAGPLAAADVIRQFCHRSADLLKAYTLRFTPATQPVPCVFCGQMAWFAPSYRKSIRTEEAIPLCEDCYLNNCGCFPVAHEEPGAGLLEDLGMISRH